MDEKHEVPTERRRRRGWRRIPPFAWLRPSVPHVSVIRLGGVIGRTGPLRAVGLSLDGLERAIDRAFAPRRLAAVALAVNSPGGSPVQSALIAQRIRRHAEKRGVPVLAFAEDVAASGGYWLACAADEIFAEESSIIGSIGVISAGFGFHDLLARHGIERRVHAVGPRKGMLDPFRPEAEDDVRRLVALQAEMHETFKAHVRARRGRRLKAADEVVFSGDIWTGRGAVAVGLVDGIGDMRTVLRERFGERVRIRPIAARPGWRRRIGFGGAAGAGLAGPAPGEIAAELLAALDEWAMWKRFGL